MERCKMFEDALKELEAIERMEARSEEQYKAYDDFYNSFEGWEYELFIKYRNAKDRKNQLIDFDDCPREDEIPTLVDCLRKCGIRHITVSSGWSSMIKQMWVFCQAGCKVEGMIEINGLGKNWPTGEPDKVPAFLLSVENQGAMV